MAFPLDSRWTRHLESNDRSKFENAVRNDTLVLGRLLAILEDLLNEQERTEDTIKQFDNPNWAYLMAFKNGERSNLKKVMTLLQFIKE